jgi:hypothetical protein
MPSPPPSRKRVASPQLPGWHARHRRDAGAERRHRDLHGGVEVHRIVFEVEEQPVIAARLHHRRDVDRAGLAQDHANRQFARVEPLARGIPQQRGHLPLLGW